MATFGGIGRTGIVDVRTVDCRRGAGLMADNMRRDWRGRVGG